MKREFLGGEIRQNHLTGFFCINDITKIGNAYRKNSGLPVAKWVKYKDSKKSKEFFISLMNSEETAEIITAQRGKGGLTWVHPLVFFDYAMWLSPDFKVAVYKWLYDNLVVFRDDSGNSYKEMSKVLFETQGYEPAKGAVIVSSLARAIKRDLQWHDWDKATPELLKKRDSIHKGMITALKMGVEPTRAYHVIRAEVLKESK